MSLHRGLLNWGVFLVVLGAVVLANQLGYLDSAVAASLLRLWPLILIAIGVGIILRFTPLHAVGGLLAAGTLGLLGGALIVGGVGAVGGACVGTDGQPGTLESRSGPFAAGEAHTRLELTCVSLLVQREEGNDWRVEAEFVNNDPRLNATADRLELRTAGGPGLPFTDSRRREVDVYLPQELPLSLDLTLNAARATVRLPGELRSVSGTFNAADVSLELSGARMSGGSLNLTLNAASANVSLPAADLSVNVTLNAASLDLCVAPELGLLVNDRATLGANNYADAGLERVGERWQTPGYDGAAARAQLNISSNVSSINLQRTGACP